MEHDGREKTYAKLIQKYIHILVGVSIENAHVKKRKKKKAAHVEPQLIKSEDGDDKEKRENHF